ncbi:MAG: universal stress protein [Marinoscillum sp.]|uniref:universal stress protein n=1 Tax=Marinoscillum sp. TaxID=2024838 RepID=UPI0033041F1B
MKKILFPTDFSERANRALKQAVAIAESFNSKIIIHHTYSRPVHTGDGSGHMETLLHKAEHSIDKEFKKLFDQNRELKNVEHEFHKQLGVSIENIVEISKMENIDFIIMATKGANGLGELWGTKTARIVKSVDIPVLVIPDNTSLADINTVGLICDYSKEANYHSLDFLLALAEKLKLNIDTITLNRNEKVMTENEKAYRQLVRKKLEPVPTSFHVVFSENINEGIIDYSKKNNIGLIAMMPKSYSFMERLFHESLTEKMAFSSPLPLLVLK